MQVITSNMQGQQSPRAFFGDAPVARELEHAHMRVVLESLDQRMHICFRHAAVAQVDPVQQFLVGLQTSNRHGHSNWVVPGNFDAVPNEARVAYNGVSEGKGAFLGDAVADSFTAEENVLCAL